MTDHKYRIARLTMTQFELISDLLELEQGAIDEARTDLRQNRDNGEWGLGQKEAAKYLRDRQQAVTAAKNSLANAVATNNPT